MNVPKKLILSLDDDEDFNNILKFHVKKIGHNIITTTSVVDFSKKLKENAVDLYIIDLNLKEKEGAGYQLIEAIKKTRKNPPPILVFSKQAKGRDIQLALSKGANDFIQKPLDQLVLNRKINELLQHHHYEDGMKYRDIPTQNHDAIVTVHFLIKELREEEILILGEQSFPKNERLTLSGNTIRDIFQQECITLFVKYCKEWAENKYQICLEMKNEPELVHLSRNYIFKSGRAKNGNSKS